MQVKLPITGHTVELEDYITQETVEAVEEILLARINMADESWARVSNEEVARIFPEIYDEISKEKDPEKKDILMMKAKKRVAATDPERGGVSGADFNKSQRVEVAYTITKITLKDGTIMSVTNRDAINKWILKLPLPDYQKLRVSVDEIVKKMRANLKSTGEA